MNEIFDFVFIKLQAHIFMVLIFLLKKYVQHEKDIAVNQATINKIDKNVDRLINNSIIQAREKDKIKLV